MKKKGLTQMSAAELGKQFGYAESKVITATEKYNLLMQSTIDTDAKMDILLVITEKPDRKDIGTVMATQLIAYGVVTTLGKVTTINGIGPNTVDILIDTLSTADIEAALQDRIPEPVNAAPIAEINAVGVSEIILESPYYMGPMPGQFIAVTGCIVPGTYDPISDQATFSVLLASENAKPTTFQVDVSEYPLASLPTTTFQLVGQGLLTGSVRPILVLPFIETATICLGWQLLPIVALANAKLFRTILALKSKITALYKEIVRCFALDPDNPTIQKNASQYLHIQFLKLVIDKELLDIKTLFVGKEALEKCLEKLADAMNNSTDENRRKEIFDKMQRIRKGIKLMMDILVPKSTIAEFVIGEVLCGSKNSEKGFEELDNAIIEDILNKMRAAGASVAAIKKAQLALLLWGKAPLENPDSKAQPPKDDNSEWMDKLKDEIKKAKEEAKKLLDGFKEEQEKNAEALKKEIEKACNSGKVEMILKRLLFQIAQLINRNDQLLTHARDLAKQQLKCVERARFTLKKINVFIDLEVKIIEEAIAREKEELKKLNHPEFHAEKLDFLLNFEKLILNQVEALRGPSAIFDTEDADSIESKLDEKEEAANAALKSFKDREKQYRKYMKRLSELLR